MRPMMIPRCDGSGRTARRAFVFKSKALGYTLTDINLPGAYVVLSIDDLGQIAGSYGTLQLLAAACDDASSSVLKHCSQQEGGFRGFQ